MIINKLSIISVVVGVVVILVAAIVGFAVLPKVIRNKIEEEVSLIPESETWEKWVDITRPIYFKAHFFNVTNPVEYLSGAEQPKILEVGPYVYRQKRRKINLRQPDGPRSVFYEQETYYMFDAEESNGLLENDTLTVLNVPYALISDGFKKIGLPDQFIINLFNANLTNERLVQSMKVADLLFYGIPVGPYVELLQSLNAPVPDAFASGTFALYDNRTTNGSTDGEYKIHTGVGDSSLFGETILYNGSPDLGFWQPLSHCDKINGSDGSIFPPFVKKEQRIPIFSSDLCRSVDLVYDSETKMYDIKAYRFKLARDALQDPVQNRNNRCYCNHADDMQCLMDGVLDISSCKQGASFVLSMPHFLHGHPKYSFDSNLTANEHEHGTYLDIEPNSGVLMEAHKRIQLNFNHRAVFGINSTAITQDMIFPILWIDEHAVLPADSAQELKDKLLSPKKAVEVWRWVVLAVGIVLTVGGAVLYVLKGQGFTPFPTK